jgi:hypothetical protein
MSVHRFSDVVRAGHWTRFLLVAAFVLCSWSCKQAGEPRNTIAFLDKEEQVIDSLRTIIEIFDNSSMFGDWPMYGLDEKGGLRIGSTEYSDFRLVLTDTTLALSKYSSAERKRLAQLILFLRHNRITGGLWREDARAWCFLYDLGPLEHIDESRSIVLCENLAMMKNIEATFEVVQVKGSLILVAPKGSRIH